MRLLACAVAVFVACSGRGVASTGIALPPGGGRVGVLSTASAADGLRSYADVASDDAAFVPFAQYQRRGWPVSVWIRFSIAGSFQPDEEAWFIILPRWTESAQLYRAGSPPLRTGMYVPLSQRPDDFDLPSFPIVARDFGGAPLLLHLVYYPDTDLDIALMTRSAVSAVVEPTYTIEGMFFGVLLAVGVLNLFVFATTRSKNALWYVLWIASLWFGELATSGIGDRYLWANLSMSSRLLTYLAQVLAVIVFYTFARTFLRTKTEAPVLDRLLIGYIWLYVALQTASALVPGGSALVPVVILLAVGGMLLGLFVGVVRYRSGFIPARYFSLAFVPLTVGMGAALSWQILQPPMDGLWFWAYNGGEVGIMLQTIVLSFGVADRIRILEGEMQSKERQLTEVSEVARSMERLAHVDALTGLANRVRFSKALDECVASHARRKEAFAVLFCDLDGFKEVNDRFGHNAGDEVLRIAARRLVGSLRGSDLVSRLGGDEFAVVLDRTSLEQATGIAKALESALDEPIVVDGVTMPIGISIGTAIYPADGETTGALLAFADRRMYETKHRRARETRTDNRRGA